MLQEIQKFDYDRYLSLIFCPKDKRADIEAIILFNIEIARIKAKVSEPMMGMIRLQWWREAIDELFDSGRTPRRHNIVNQLKNVIGRYPKISKEDFLSVINAREKDLDNNPFQTLDEFNAYLFATSYPINKLMLDILEVEDKDIIAATREISEAWAICAILRSAYKNFSSNRSVFPSELMQKHNLNMSDFGKDKFVEISKPLVQELCDTATKKLGEAKALLKNAPKAEKKKATAVLLNLKTTKHHLKQIRRNKYDIFTKNLNPYLGVANLVCIYIKSASGDF